jgi:MFS family permease
VCAAHFVSHYYILVLPPLFGFVRADYGVSYTELGLALTAFNVVSAMLQTPAGFLVDRVSARLVLIAGLLLGATGLAVAGLVNSFWVFVAMFAVAGLGNTVYHPADYALLSHHVSPERIGQAFSVHTFAGILGGAVAPASLLLMQSLWGWRGAFLGAAVLGLAAAAYLAMQQETGATASPTKERPNEPASPAGWRLLLSGPVFGNFLLFILLAIANGGFQNYSVVALGALHGTSAAFANTALTGYLVLTAIGVLLGGLVVARTARYGLVTATSLCVGALVALAIALLDPGSLAIVALMSLAGLFTGLFLPSRDMIVRSVTPPGSFGKVFGFVTTGFNIAGVFSPLMFGAVMDHGNPQAVFLIVAVCSTAGILMVVLGPLLRRT